MDIEICSVCEDDTGNAGVCDDSLFLDELGPLCVFCCVGIESFIEFFGFPEPSITEVMKNA